MTTVAFLVDGDDAEFAIGRAVAEQLARLGVTHVALFHERDTVCIVLEGWAFDASTSAGAAAAALGGTATFRTLRPVMQTALRATTEEN